RLYRAGRHGRYSGRRWRPAQEYRPAGREWRQARCHPGERKSREEPPFMIVIDAARLTELTPYGALADALAGMFRQDCPFPQRQTFDIPVEGSPDGRLFLMPAWIIGSYMGLKVACVFPGNSARGVPTTAAQYMLFSSITGEVLALMHGETLTSRR